MVEQPGPLTDIMVPGNALDPSARLPVFPPVEQDAFVFLGEVVQQLDALIDPQVGPLLDPGIEPTRRIHQQGGAVAPDLISRCDPVYLCHRHKYDPLHEGRCPRSNF